MSTVGVERTMAGAEEKGRDKGRAKGRAAARKVRNMSGKGNTQKK